MVQAAGRDGFVGDPVVDDTRTNAELLRYFLYRLFSQILFVHRWNRVLVPYPGNAGAGEGVAFVALESLGVELSGDFVIGVVLC